MNTTTVKSSPRSNAQLPAPHSINARRSKYCSACPSPPPLQCCGNWLPEAPRSGANRSRTELTLHRSAGLPHRSSCRSCLSSVAIASACRPADATTDDSDVCLGRRESHWRYASAIAPSSFRCSSATLSPCSAGTNGRHGFESPSAPTEAHPEARSRKAL